MAKSRECLITPCGEEESNWSVYDRPDPKDTHYSEKTDHKARTLYHDKRPNGHRSFFYRKGKNG